MCWQFMREREISWLVFLAATSSSNRWQFLQPFPTLSWVGKYIWVAPQKREPENLLNQFYFFFNLPLGSIPSIFQAVYAVFSFFTKVQRVWIAFETLPSWMDLLLSSNPESKPLLEKKRKKNVNGHGKLTAWARAGAEGAAAPSSFAWFPVIAALQDQPLIILKQNPIIPNMVFPSSQLSNGLSDEDKKQILSST